MTKKILCFLCGFFLIAVINASGTPITGTFTIPGNYPSIVAAVSDINLNGVDIGGVTINVAAGYTESTTGIFLNTPTTTDANHFIIFKKSGTGANPLVTGTGTSGTDDPVIQITGTSYVTFDAIDIAASGVLVEYGYLIMNASPTVGAQHNTIKNCRITLNNTNNSSVAIRQLTAFTPTVPGGADSYNVFLKNIIDYSYSGIVIDALVDYPDVACIIDSNSIGTAGYASLGGSGGAQATWGIRSNYVNDVKVFGNEVCNIVMPSNKNIGGIYVHGSNGVAEMYNNKVHDLYVTSQSLTSIPIALRMEEFPNNTGNIYNNVVWGLYHSLSTPNTTMVVRAISVNSQAQYTGMVNVYYNTVTIAPGPIPTSTAFSVLYGTVSLKNNILLNLSSGGATSRRYCIYANANTLLESDYNDMYVPSGTNNFIGYYAGNNCQTLAAWNLVTIKDMNSQNLNVTFVSPTNLHINPNANCTFDNKGTYITGAMYAYDFDAEVRSTTTPDIGADEFTSVLPSITSTVPGHACIEGTVTLGAFASSGTIQWWDSPANGSLLGTGNTFTTPYLYYTTDYYVDVIQSTCVSAQRIAVTASILPNLPVSVIITNDANSVCPGTVVNFNATPANGGLFPSYQWFVNSLPAGSNSSTFSYSPLNGDVVYCQLLSSEPCTTGNPAISNSITMVTGYFLPPSVTCPANIVVPNDQGICGAQVFYTAPVSGNCTPSVLNQTSGLPSGSVFPVGTTTNTFLVTNDTGQSASCSFTVTVNDTEAPWINCPSILIVPNDPGDCGAVVNFSVTYGDNCTGSVLTQLSGQPANSYFEKGMHTCEYQVTDQASNTNLCTTYIYVSDDEIPTLTCPGNQTKNTDPGLCSYTIQGSEFDPVYFDNCGVTIINDPFWTNTLAGQILPTGITTITWIATDVNSNNAFCNFTITIVDNQPPDVACPGNIAISNEPGLCGAHAIYDVHAIDNCDNYAAIHIAGPLSGDFFPLGITPVTYQIIDPVGNITTCSFTVSVTDMEMPAITCPGNILANNDAGECNATLAFAVNYSDNCPGASLTQLNGLPSGADFPVGSTLNKFLVTDAHNNSNVCNFEVTVTDNQAPVLICPANQYLPNDFGYCYYTVQGTEFDPYLWDNCGASMSNNYNAMNTLDGFWFPEGTTNVTWTAVDINGHQTNCSFNVTIQDIVPPLIICPSDTILCYEDAGFQVITMPYYAWDNCNIQSIVTNQPTVLPLGNTTVTWTVTDFSGLSASCTQSITLGGPVSANIVQSLLPEFCQGEYILLTANVNGNSGTSYIWSTGETTQSIQVSDPGIYAVTVSNTVGCQAYSSVAAVVDIPGLLSSYVILTRTHIQMKQSKVLSGGLGVINDDHGHGKIDVKEKSLITAPGTFIKSSELHIDNSSLVTTVYNQAADLELPAFEIMPYSGSISKNVPAGTTVYLTDTLYKEVKVGKNATAIFTRPVVNIEKQLKLEDGAIIRFAACAKVRTKDNIECGKNITINPDGTGVVFYIGHDGKFKEGAHVTGVFIFGEIKHQGADTTYHHLHIEDSKKGHEAVFKGMFFAECVHSGKYTSWLMNPLCNYCNPQIPKDLDAVVQADDQTGVLIESTIGNYPNPFSDFTTITFKLAEDDFATLDVLDLNGKLIQTLYTGEVSKDKEYTIKYNGMNIPDGIYIYQLTTRDKIMTGKMILIR